MPGGEDSFASHQRRLLGQGDLVEPGPFQKFAVGDLPIPDGFNDKEPFGVAEGLAIVDTIDDISSPVRTHCYGRADAMAAVIILQSYLDARSASV